MSVAETAPNLVRFVRDRLAQVYTLRRWLPPCATLAASCRADLAGVSALLSVVLCESLNAPQRPLLKPSGLTLRVPKSGNNNETGSSPHDFGS